MSALRFTASAHNSTLRFSLTEILGTSRLEYHREAATISNAASSSSHFHCCFREYIFTGGYEKRNKNVKVRKTKGGEFYRSFSLQCEYTQRMKEKGIAV